MSGVESEKCCKAAANRSIGLLSEADHKGRLAFRVGPELNKSQSDNLKWGKQNITYSVILFCSRLFLQDIQIRKPVTCRPKRGELMPGIRQEASTSENSNHQPFKYLRLALNLFLIAAAFYLIVYSILQNIYDFHLFEYRSLVRRISLGLVNASELVFTGIPMKQALIQDRRRLKMVGSPYINFSFAVECAIFYAIFLYLIAYLQPYFYFKLLHPEDLKSVHMLVDAQYEQRNYNKLIRRELNKFNVSGRNLIRVQQAYSVQNGYAEKGDIKAQKASLTVNNLRESGRIRQRRADADLVQFDHLLERIREMTSAGALKPLNRQPGPMRNLLWLTDRYVIMFTLGTASTLLFFLTPYLGWSYADYHQGKVVVETGFRDIAGTVIAHLFSLFCILATGSYTLLLLMGTLDQIQAVMELIKVAKLCIARNENIVHRMRHLEWAQSSKSPPPIVSKNPCGLHRLSPTRGPPTNKGMAAQVAAPLERRLEDARITINANLLVALFHYKLLVRQSRASMSMRRFLALMVVELEIPSIVLGRIYAPYMSRSAKFFLILIIVCIICWIDVILAPVCYLYCRCEDLYKSLFSLMAHSLDVGCSEPADKRSYHRHTLLALKKELSHPDLLVSQFALRPLGMVLTYPNLVRLHFWCGLLLMSILHAEHDVTLSRSSSFLSESLYFI